MQNPILDFSYLDHFLFDLKLLILDSSTPTKYDVVRSIDAVDNGRLKEINEDDHIPAQTRYVFGHKLEVHSRTSWCDSCEELIWGLNIQAVRCQCKDEFLIIIHSLFSFVSPGSPSTP